MQVIKQSLIDWQIVVDGVSVGWIAKEKIGYRLKIKEGNLTYFEASFKDCKTTAKIMLNI